MSAAAARPDRRVGGTRRLIARAFDIAIALSALVATVLAVAGAFAPRLDARIDPAAVSSDGGHAYTFSPGFHTHWPYVVPSHPESTLVPGDAELTEDGRSIGAPQPSHAVIRELGGGLFNVWQGSVWFSPDDDTDPRTNGRSYRFELRTRLTPAVLAARDWSLGLFTTLILFRIATVLSARAGPALMRVGGKALSPLHRIVGRLPLTFRRSYWSACALVLGGFAIQALIRPMPLIFTSDSFTYVQPGILWAAGESVAGQSTRDVGYPALTALALALGSLDRLPVLQLFIVMGGLGCLLAVLFRAFRLIADRLVAATGLPIAATGVFACATGVGYLVLMFSHDLFVLDIESAMGEAPHLLPTAATLLLLVASWTARTPRARLASAIGAAVAAYLSIMVKPHTSMVLALCVVSVAIVALRDFRAFRSPSVLALCLASGLTVAGVHRADAIVSPTGGDFGPKTIFCNHVDVVLPGFETSTPERGRIAAVMRATLQPSNDWPLMGFVGDRCVYNNVMADAIAAAARAEGSSSAAWEQHEFLKAVAARPVLYAQDVLKQFVYYIDHPVGDRDHHVMGMMPDDAWIRFAPFLGLVRMSRDQFQADVGNWVPQAYPRLSRYAKAVLQGVNATFAAVTLGSTALAFASVMLLRGRADLRLEASMLATAAFTMAFVATIALTHTFDVGRYLTDILPISLVWWTLSVAYLAHVLVALSAWAARQDRHTIDDRSQSPGREAGRHLETP